MKTKKLFYILLDTGDKRFNTDNGLILILIIILAPLSGVILAGESPSPYLEFPPVTISVEHTSFSWTVFVFILLFVLVASWPFWRRFTGILWKKNVEKTKNRFPWWGWFSVVFVILFWILAWSRFPWFESYQRHTFFPLWFSMIILLNALSCKFSGRSLITDRTFYFLLLFPASAFFWWIFEYLNRFLNNWYYTGIGELDSWTYFWEATLAFSTVLPAVMSVRFILLHLPSFRAEYNNFPELQWLKSVRLWSILGICSIASLAGMGWKPEFTYPLVWIAPGLLWVVLQSWKGYTNPLIKKASEGDLALVWSSAAAALTCGFFWEMWNFYSEAKWIYNVPGVERFHIFEMPLLGYAGYLPFGVICAIVANSLLSTLCQDDYVVQEELETPAGE